jgi:hypothetical protein
VLGAFVGAMLYDTVRSTLLAVLEPELVDGERSPIEHRSAFLKERGRVKVLVLVVSSVRADAARMVVGMRSWLVVGFRTRVRRSEVGRLGCRAFLR